MSLSQTDLSKAPKIKELYEEYLKERFIELNVEQFVYMVSLFPGLLVALSDGWMDSEEWVTIKKMSRILGSEFASEDLGDEKEENLSLIYKAEFRFLMKNKEAWRDKFLEALKEYFDANPSAKEFVMDTMYLFASSSEGISPDEDDTIESLADYLGLELS